MPEAGTPVVTRVVGPGGGEVQLTSEISKGVFHLKAPLEEVWSGLPRVFGELGVEVTYQDPRVHGMGNNNFRARRMRGKRNSRYLDCGYGSTAVPNADAYDVTASLVTSLRSGEGGGSVLETLFQASARARDVSGGTIPCTSTGRLEREMADLLVSFVGGSPDEGRALPVPNSGRPVS